MTISAQEADTLFLCEVLVTAELDTTKTLPLATLQKPLQAMDVLDQITGIIRVQEATFPISYRGQTGSRLRIQQNGARRNGLNPQGYLAQDLNATNLGEARMVNGVEKASYGSGAIGGVLVLEDRQADDPLPNLILSSFGTNNAARQLGFRWHTGKEKTHFEITGNGIQTNDYKFSNRETAQNSAFHAYHISTALHQQIKNNRLQWRQKWSWGNWQLPQGFQNNPFELRDLNNNYTYQTDVSLTNQLKNQWKLKHQAWGLIVATEQTQDQYNAQFDAVNFQIVRGLRRTGWGYNGFLEKSTERFDLKTGLDVFVSRLEEERTENDQVRNISFDQLAANRSDQQAGAFIQMRTKGRKIQWTGVFRSDLATSNNLDAKRDFSSAVSGGFEAHWSLWKLNQRLSLGRYFRFPRPEETGGELFGGRGIFRGNPAIKPEYSYQLEWAIFKKINSTSLKVSSWLAYFDDRIVALPVENGVFQYRNISQARTYGLEWEVSQILLDHTKHQLTGLFSGLAMKGDDLSNANLLKKGDRSEGIPPTNFRGELRYKSRIGQLPIQLSIDARHFMKFIAPSGFTNQVWAVRDAPAYTLLGLQVNTRFHIGNEWMSVTTSVSNLTDTGFFPFGTRIMGMGRNFVVGIDYSF